MSYFLLKRQKLLTTACLATCFFYLSAQVQIDHQIQMTGAGSDAEITGIKNVADNQDAVNVDAIQKGYLVYGVATGSSNNFILSLSPPITSYQAGMAFNFISNQRITGPATLNINGLGDIPIKKYVNQPLVGCEILNGQVVTVVYDGTNFQLH